MMIRSLSHIKMLMLGIVLSSAMVSCAQQKNVVVRSQAFLVERIPGNIPLPEGITVDGKKDPDPVVERRIDTSVVVYLETRNTSITFDTVWQGKRAYLVSATMLQQTPHQAGFEKDGKEVLIHPAKGNLLWQLQLAPIPSSPGKFSREEISIKIRSGGKTIRWKTKALKDLVPLPSV